MNLLPWIRRELISTLWQDYKTNQPQAEQILNKLIERSEKIVLDHFLIADIPGANTGLPVLEFIFEALGFIKEGQGHNPDNASDFIWMTEEGSNKKNANEALPQIVLSSFKIQNLSFPMQKLVSKYAQKATKAPLEEIEELVMHSELGNEHAAKELVGLIKSFIVERNYPVISRKEFEIVTHENAFLAQTLVHGRRPRHFSLAGHCLKSLGSLSELNDFILSQCRVDLAFGSLRPYINGVQGGGLIYSKTSEIRDVVQFSDGPFLVSAPHFELVWRFTKMKSVNRPALWVDYFTGFLNSTHNPIDQKEKSQISSL